MQLMQRKIIGLDIDDNCVVATELIRKPRGIYLGKYANTSNPGELIKDTFIKESGIVINLPTQIILLRTFKLEPSLSRKPKELTAVLGRQNLPFKLEECYWDTFTLNNHLNFIAAKKEVVERYIAQVKELPVVGITTSLVALYNVFIYNYPQENRFALLNIKTAASDLLICESKRIWIYPLSIGARDFKQQTDALERFSLEVQRTFSSHYLQNPIPEKTSVRLYLTGQDSFLNLITSLKKNLGDFEIIVLDPLKKINLLPGTKLNNRETFALSLGLGLSYFSLPGCLNINLIKEKIKKEKQRVVIKLLKKTSLLGIIFTILLLLWLDIGLVKNLTSQIAVNKNTQIQVLEVLPQVKALNEKKAKFTKAGDFLKKKLEQQRFYLQALAAISEIKAPAIKIKEFNAQIKEERLEVILSGSSPTYEEINDFLTKLKKNEDIEEAKVIASTFSAFEAETKPIDFKLRFEIER